MTKLLVIFATFRSDGFEREKKVGAGDSETLLVHLRSHRCLWFSDSVRFYGYIGWRWGWCAGVTLGECHGAVVLVAYAQARDQQKGVALTKTHPYPPSTLRERTAGRALSTVCRKRACGSFGATLIHFKTWKKQYWRLKGSFYRDPANILTNTSISTYYSDVTQSLKLRYWKCVCVHNTSEHLNWVFRLYTVYI
jgi:hypothetical protein